jgi:hypothetical protein
MTDIDRLLIYEDDSFGVIPLVIAKAAKVAAKHRGQPAEAAPAPVVVVPPPAPSTSPAIVAVSALVALGLGFGVGYVASRRG